MYKVVYLTFKISGSSNRAFLNAETLMLNITGEKFDTSSEFLRKKK